MAVVSVAISFLVIILSITISAGFRKQIRDGLSSLTGDIQLTSPRANDYSSEVWVNSDPAFLPALKEVKGVGEVTPAIYRAGIVQGGGELQGVLFKAVPSSDTIPLQISVPRSLARTLRLSVGDEVRAYFVGERVQVRKFTVKDINTVQTIKMVDASKRGSVTLNKLGEGGNLLDGTTWLLYTESGELCKTTQTGDGTYSYDENGFTPLLKLMYEYSQKITTIFNNIKQVFIIFNTIH